jgi:hypothetical protein
VAVFGCGAKETVEGEPEAATCLRWEKTRAVATMTSAMMQKVESRLWDATVVDKMILLGVTPKPGDACWRLALECEDSSAVATEVYRRLAASSLFLLPEPLG